MSRKKFKWSPSDATDESSLDFTEEETQMADDVSPAEQFISWPLAEDTPAKGENPVASIEAPAPTAKELARLNRFPPA